ncbi:MFS general substrate transporter [Ramicandelaber brevisporus]|nr:MFS general substrate transporter [Ramicandelaber brevisporus]
MSSPRDSIMSGGTHAASDIYPNAPAGAHLFLDGAGNNKKPALYYYPSLNHPHDDLYAHAAAAANTTAAPSLHEDKRSIVPTPDSVATILNLHFWRRCYTVALMSIMSFLGLVGVTAFFPSVADFTDVVNISQEGVAAALAACCLFTSIFPIFWAKFADKFGRRQALLVTLSCFVVTSAVLAGVSHTNIIAYAAVRLLHGAVATAFLVLAAAVISDIVAVDHRGRAIGFALVLPLLGPVAGARLSQVSNIAVTFGVIAGVAAIVLVLIFFTVPETQRDLVTAKHYGYVSSERAATVDDSPLHVFKYLTHPVSALGTLAVSIAFGVFLGWFSAAYPQVSNFAGLENASKMTSTLSWTLLTTGLGAAAGSIIAGNLCDIPYRHIAEAILSSEKLIEENGVNSTAANAPPSALAINAKAATRRLAWIYPGLVIYPAGIITFGWAVSSTSSSQLSYSLASSFFLGFGFGYTMAIAITYLLDAVERRPEGVIALCHTVGGVVAAICLAIVPVMQDHLSQGWTFTILGAAPLLVLPVVLVLRLRGAAMLSAGYVAV